MAPVGFELELGILGLVGKPLMELTSLSFSSSSTTFGVVLTGPCTCVRLRGGGVGYGDGKGGAQAGGGAADELSELKTLEPDVRNVTPERSASTRSAKVQ